MARREPTLRIPLGILGMLTALGLYAAAVVWTSRWFDWLPALAQAAVYLVLGIVWILPLKRFLAWMETGRWKPPSGASDGT